MSAGEEPPVCSLTITPRYEKVIDRFKEVYGSPPDFYARAPGRVNLIGEHIDYNGYPVLPFALEQDVLIAVRADSSSHVIRLHNLEDNKFPYREIDASNFVVDGSTHDWSDYFLAGYKGITEHCNISTPIGLSAVVHGTVLMGAGLSSSSAFVCASALAVARLFGLKLSKSELANITQKCERYIGMEGGGMDQAISFLAHRGTAKLIEFNPLTTFDVHLPAEATFVICNSLVESMKYLTAGTNYNMRVVECKLGSAVLAKSMGLTWQNVKTPENLHVISKNSLDELQGKVKSLLHPEEYTKDEVANLLEMSVEQLEATYFTSRVKVLGTFFNLYNRLLHVFSEANRVYKFREICNTPDYKNSLTELGKLMDESHFSCSKDYDCSCPELDNLTAICRKEGALGSRLTGAGWGGCVISLVPTSLVETFFEKVKSEYYSLLIAAQPLPTEEYMFTTQPGSGAAVFVDS